MKTKLLEHVEEFTKAVRLNEPEPEPATIPDRGKLALRARLIMEEALETVEAMGIRLVARERGDLVLKKLMFIHDREPDLVKIVDGLCDIHYVTAGGFYDCGLPDEPFLDEVCSNNAMKIATGSRDGSGKLIKSPDHPQPNIAGIIDGIVACDPTFQKQG